MRIALCQMNTVVGDLDGNAAAIVEWSRAAAATGADLALFPEQAICGYPAEDLLLKRHFLERCQLTLAELAPLLELPSLVGFPELGMDVYNSCAVIADGAVQGIYRKQHLPNYGVFDEHRYFRQGSQPALIRVGDATIGLTICEDIWLASGPANIESAAGAQVIVNLSASPFSIGRGATRERMLATRAADSLACVVLCNQVGGQDELVFDGHSVVVDHLGAVIARGAQCAEQLLVCDLDIEEVIAARLQDTRHRSLSASEPELPMLATIAARHADSGPARPAVDREHISLPQRRLSLPGEPAQVPPSPEQGSVTINIGERPELLGREAEVYAALRLGLHDYIAKNGFERVVLGLSGGIDSALVLALAVDTIGSGRVLAATMPSQFSSDGTRGDAHRMADILGVELLELPIEPVMIAYADVLATPFAGAQADITEENLQARIRGNLLMALSNKFGHLVLTTGNKSEISVGYMTLYGDMAGGFAPLKDVSKTLVYELSRWRNQQAANAGEPAPIPQSIIDRPPSAELRANQRDTDSLPDYDSLDRLLEAIVEHDRGREELLEEGFDPATVDRVARLVDRAEYKRRQAPPGIRISTRAFGRDRRMPITNRFEDREGAPT